MERVRFVVELLSCQRNGNKHEQPKKWVATDFLKEQLHGTMIQFAQTLAIRNTTKVRWADRMESIKRGSAGCILTERLIGRVLSPNENDSCPPRLPLIN